MYRALWRALQVHQNTWFWVWLCFLKDTLYAEEELQQICQAQFPFTSKIALGFSWQSVKAGDHICWSGALFNGETLRPVAKVLTKLWFLKYRLPKLGRSNLWSTFGKRKVNKSAAFCTQIIANHWDELWIATSIRKRCTRMTLEGFVVPLATASLFSLIRSCLMSLNNKVNQSCDR